MKKLLVVLNACIFVFLVNAQDYSRVKISLVDADLNLLNQLGLAVDHGTYKEGTFFISDFSSFEIKLLKENNIQHEILISDVSRYYVEQSKIEHPIGKNVNCDPAVEGQAFNPNVPTNFHLGSMAGFYTYQEMLQELDEMRQAFPNLISVKASIDTFLTTENRPIYFVRISDNPDVHEASEKEVMYSAIHHAREPNSMTATIFYMWYLLENYANSTEIQFLLNNTELYFIPCLNPDGYIQNETTNPNGGGMHRKNRRDVGTTNKGVDLNRNYSYGWGTTGVNFNQNSDTYPGTGPFSEIETQAMRWFVKQHSFKLAFNAHTYGDLLLFPIGTTDAEFAVHHDYFQKFTDYMVQYNGYVNQKSSGLYPASGDSDDYMYEDDLANKPRIFAITPEIGSNSFGFWPPQNQIIPNSKNMIFPNITMAHLAHRFLLVSDKDASRIEVANGNFNHAAQRIGMDSGMVTVQIQPLMNIVSVGNPINYDLALMQTQQGVISYTLNPSIQFNDTLKYVLETVYANWIKRDTIVKIFGGIPVVLVDNADTPGQWTGNWTTNAHTSYSPTKAYSDSESGGNPTNYSNNTTRTFTFNQTIDLTTASLASISFYAKWDVEADYDYCQFQVSVDGGQSWIGQCGKYTVPGESANGSVQPNNEPVYEGVSAGWVLEEISLSDYLGQSVKFRFVLKSDGAVTKDGYYFDDFTISHNGSTGLIENTKIFTAFPNPTSGELILSFDKVLSNGQMELLDLNGKVIVNKTISFATTKMTLSTVGLNNGVYYLVYKDENNRFSQPQKIVVLNQ